MEPMHEDYDLKQEQLNKSSLLSSDRFLDGLLDMWTTHVVSKINRPCKQISANWRSDSRFVVEANTKAL